VIRFLFCGSLIFWHTIPSPHFPRQLRIQPFLPIAVEIYQWDRYSDVDVELMLDCQRGSIRISVPINGENPISWGWWKVERHSCMLRRWLANTWNHSTSYTWSALSNQHPKRTDVYVFDNLPSTQSRKENIHFPHVCTNPPEINVR